MTRPIFEPTLERTDSALGYDKAQLQRRPAPIGSGAIQWVRLFTETNQIFAADDRAGIIYESVTNNYPDIFTVGLSGSDPFSVELLTTGLYQATIRVRVTNGPGSPSTLPHPPSGFSLELLGTDYFGGVGAYDSVFVPGYLTVGGWCPLPTQGIPFASGDTWKIDHMFMGNDEFFSTSIWEIEGFITSCDEMEIYEASLEVRRLGDVDFWPVPGGS